MRDSRIKSYDFQGLTSFSTGSINAFSSHPINGIILKIGFDPTDTPANGSVYIKTSGVHAEWLLHKNGGNNVNWVVYPRPPATDVSGVGLGAGSAWAEYAVNDVIHVACSGLGDGKIINSLKIWYQ